MQIYVRGARSRFQAIRARRDHDPALTDSCLVAFIRVNTPNDTERKNQTWLVSDERRLFDVGDVRCLVVICSNINSLWLVMVHQSMSSIYRVAGFDIENFDTEIFNERTLRSIIE